MHCEEMLSPKLILKPFATDPVAPIASAGYPFEPEITMEIKEQHVDIDAMKSRLRLSLRPRTKAKREAMLSQNQKPVHDRK